MQTTTRRATLAMAASALASAWPAFAQHYPVTAGQRAVAAETAAHGVPISELAPNAPETYVVKRGDTLWAIAGVYLQRPWRWPELWGMNLQQIRNPHLIYPGQVLWLERVNGMARLRVGRPGGGYGTDGGTVRLSPETRVESLGDGAIPTLKPQLIEPFLAEPLVVDAGVLDAAPRLVGMQGERVMMARGDRAYAIGPEATPLLREEGVPRDWRVFRRSVELRDPATGQILGYEAQYVGRMRLVRGQSVETSLRDGRELTEVVPATLEVTGSKEEMRAGDRLLPEPPRQLLSYVPHAPTVPVEDGRVVSIYGSAVANAAQNQIVSINKGANDGIEVGHVLAILSEGPRIVDRTTGRPVALKLPDERNGLLMVFRTFDRVSYALILQINDSVKVGDRVVAPR